MSVALITGANRGLGLEFVQQYLSKGWRVLAACRDPENATSLNKLAQNGNVEILQLDVTDETSINQLGAVLTGQAIDHLVLNAGVLGTECSTLGNMTQVNWLEVLNINTVAPALLIQMLYNNVASSEHKTIVGISSRVASIGDNGSGNMYSYRTSKAALNQILVSAARNLSQYGIKTLAVHPGWVKTDMGGEDATFTPQQSVSGIIHQAQSLTLEQSGSFKVFDGSNIEW
ncbi:SDR family oxidoreductase [Vibrio gallicus]|uniref:SDR family oxidoreductase n=1 Tax=Vibrio gallicus TaxID=190897 RepID=UPI0021C2ACC4|nr:SDR family oxidoreductase [Vibrio gallicus]